jgi:hypothetical protein
MEEIEYSMYPSRIILRIMFQKIIFAKWSYIILILFRIKIQISLRFKFVLKKFKQQGYQH